jgi:hypothetical protein
LAPKHHDSPQILHGRCEAELCDQRATTLKRFDAQAATEREGKDDRDKGDGDRNDVNALLTDSPEGKIPAKVSGSETQRIAARPVPVDPRGSALPGESDRGDGGGDRSR